MSSIVQPSSISPYDSLQNVYVTGYDTIIAEFSGTPTIDQLTTYISSFLQSQFYPSGTLPEDQTIQLTAVVGNVFNAYTSPDDIIPRYYSKGQMGVINLIYELKTISINGNTIGNWASGINDLMADSSLSAAELAPIQIAGAAFGSCYEYFYEQILSPDANWAPYLDANPAVNFENLSNWVIAAFRGSLIGAIQSTPVVSTDAPQGTGIAVNFVSSMGGGLAGVFGEILFHWVERPRPL